MQKSLLAVLTAGAMLLPLATVADDAKAPEITAEAAASTLPEGVLAIVNGKSISTDLLDVVLAQFPAGQPLPPKDQVIQEIINIQVLAQAAEQDGLTDDPQVQAELEIQRAQTLANAWVQKFSESVDISDEDLQAEYARQTANLGKAEYRARHILVDSEEEAKDMIARLNDGGDFKALAEEFSKDPGSEGGELGWFAPSMMAPEFAAAVEALEVGAISAEPVKTSFGWHVIELEEKREAALPDFEAVKPGLRNLLERQKIGEQVQVMAEEAKIQR